MKPNVHYVEFTDEKDLIEKMNYYLDNDNERDYIANKGHEIYKKKYNAKTFWNNIMKGVGYDI